MGISVLGPLTVEGQTNGLAPRDRVVLAALVVTVGELVPSERLADAVWPGSPPATWNKVLQGSIVRLRRALGPNSIETVGHGYRLAVHADEVDSRRFERLVSRARELLRLGEPARALYALEEALALWRGRAFVELEAWDSGRIEAERLEELRRDAEELRLEAALRTGHHRKVLSEAQARVQEAPLRERRWELLALAQYQSGHQSDALRTIHQVKTTLMTELGLDPSPSLMALEQAILRQDPSLLVEQAMPEPSTTCPYLGLVPYDVDDAEGFFGRDADIQACLHRLTDADVLAVVGPSGSGKSSLVRAGLVPALQRDGRRVVVMTPGSHPMNALSSVPSSGKPVTLVVDQCEEAVSLCDDPGERAAFFATLVEYAEHRRLVVALRADRLGDVSTHSDFARFVERGLYLLNPMSAENLAEAIEGPARQAGLRLEPGLVELLVREVEGEPGALPQLSHALRQTWEHREGATLTLAGYRATGGIRHAVAQSAEHLYEQVPADQRPMLRDLMLRLVTPSPEGEPVRGRVPRRVVAADEEHERLVERLVSARLVTSDEGVVEIAHEALAREWPRLRGWLDEDTEGQRILRHLAIAADTWDGMGRPDAELYRGTRLAQALDWRDQARPNLTPPEQAFLDAGRRLAEAEEQSAARQARHQRRINRRLRALLAGVVFLLIAALVAGTLAVRQANRATDATQVADARRVAAQSQLADGVGQSLQLALAALALDPSSDARASLHAALARVPQLSRLVPAANPGTGWLDISPDGKTLVVLDGGNRLWAYDTRSWQQVGTFDPQPPDWEASVICVCEPVAFSPTGDEVAVGMLNLGKNDVRLLETQTWRLTDRQLGGVPTDAAALDLDYSADGRYLAVALDQYRYDDGYQQRASASVWDLEAPARPLISVPVPLDTPSVELSPDGSVLYTIPAYNSDAPNILRAYDIATGDRIKSYGELGHPLTLSPDGSTIAYADGGDLVLAESTTGAEVRRLSGQLPGSRQIVYSDDARFVGAVSDDGTAVVWESSTGIEVDRVPSGGSGSLRFLAGGRGLVAFGDEGVIALDLDGSDRFVNRTVPSEPGGYAEGGTSRFPSPNGDAIVVATYHPSTGGTTEHVVNVATGERVELEAAGWAATEDNAISWRPDGRRIATIDLEGVLRVSDPVTGTTRVERRLQVSAGLSAWVDYSRDGKRLVVSAEDGGVALLDAQTLEPAARPIQLDGRQINFGIAGPQADQAIVFYADRPRSLFDFTQTRGWALVDLTRGTVVREASLEGGTSGAALSPDGGRLAVGGLEIVDVATGATRGTPGAEMSGAGHLVFSADGSRVAGTDGATVMLWDGRTGAPLGEVEPGGVDSVPVFLDDDTVRIAAWDGAVYEWNTLLRYAVDFACRIVGSGMTESQWNAVLPDQPYRESCQDG